MAKRRRKDLSDDFVEEVCARVYELREEAGMTLAELGAAAGLSHDAISKVELGKRTPTIRTLYLIAQGLSVDLEAIVGTRSSDFGPKLSPEALRLARYFDSLKLGKAKRAALFEFVREIAKVTAKLK